MMNKIIDIFAAIGNAIKNLRASWSKRDRAQKSMILAVAAFTLGAILVSCLG